VERVSWDDVQEFLKRLNARTGGHYRLPTEAEWEYAAGGGNTPKRTRFGNGRDVLAHSEANFDARKEFRKSYSVVGEYRGKTVKVGSFMANDLGLHDMAGNVWEWCSDWYGVYGRSTETNPTGPTTGTNRVLRGGGWPSNPRSVRLASRTDYGSSYQIWDFGFRLVSQAQ
jgi:formylglycine-generating enzyme required for sulfatase activity